MNYGEGLSASDVALLSGRNGSNDAGFGDGGAWWIIVFLIFALGGFGNNGWGGNGGGSATQGALTRGDLCMDMNFNDLQNGVRNVNDAVNLGFANLNSTVCHQEYETAGLINGVNQNIAATTAALQSTLCQGFNGINTNMMNGNFALQTSINGLSSQLQNCCCETNRTLDAMNFANAQNTCAITNAIATSTRDIVDNQNANYRALHDEIVANRIEDKNAQIQAQQNEINSLRLAASQSQQNSYLVEQLGPKQPVPAYPVFPATSFAYPTGVAFGINGFNGYNNGCGCGCGCNNF